jgi:hypothetical protein
MKRRRVKRSAPPPEPVVVPASDEFVGNDAFWSSFNVRIGTPPQVLKMTASTSSSETLVVTPEGCTPHDPRDCVTDRGQTFDATVSRTWEDWENRTEYAIEADRGLPLAGKGQYGTDTLNFMGRPHGMDPDGITIPHHIIARVSTKTYFTGKSRVILSSNPF